MQKSNFLSLGENLWNKSTVVFLIILFSLSLLIRLFYLQSPKVIEPDGVSYVSLAKNIWAGKGMIDIDGKINTVRPPGYPILIVLSHFFIADWELSARIASIFLGSIIPILIFLLTTKLYNFPIAVLSSLLVSMEPTLIFTSTHAMTEMAYIFCILLSILILFRAIDSLKPLNFLLAGLIWGLPYLIRPEGIFYLFVCLSIILAICLKSHTAKIKLYKYLVYFFLGFIIVTLPYFIFLYKNFGHFVITGKFYPLISLYNLKELNIVNEGIPAKPNILKYFILNFPSLLRIYLRNLYYVVYLQHIPRIFPILFIVFSGIGLLKSLSMAQNFKYHLSLLCFVGIPFLINPFHPSVEARYFMPILPMLFIWTSYGVREVSLWLGKNKYKHRNFNFIFMLISSLAIISYLPRLTAPFRISDKFINCPIEYKRVGIWMKKNLGPNKRLLTRMNQIAFYSESQLVPILKRIDNYEDLIKYGRENQIDYIAIDKRWTSKLYPWLTFLLDEVNIPHDLGLVYKLDERPEYKVIVYGLNKEERNEIN